ncbi:MAG: GPW/gp25 family protein [Fimbriimonas sp.]|nr:GPW/gp25 family protein [Fimbriimonas sp.]
MNMSFPYGLSTHGMTAASDEQAHARELIEAVLFTQQGERVNRPTFGAGAAQLVFSLNSGEHATSTQLLIQGVLQQTLGDRIAFNNIQVTSDDSTLSITISYTIRAGSKPGTATFVRPL